MTCFESHVSQLSNVLQFAQILVLLCLCLKSVSFEYEARKHLSLHKLRQVARSTRMPHAQVKCKQNVTSKEQYHR